MKVVLKKEDLSNRLLSIDQGVVFTYSNKNDLYMKCSMGYVVRLRDGQLFSYDRDANVYLVEGEFRGDL